MRLGRNGEGFFEIPTEKGHMGSHTDFNSDSCYFSGSENEEDPEGLVKQEVSKKKFKEDNKLDPEGAEDSDQEGGRWRWFWGRLPAKKKKKNLTQKARRKQSENLNEKQDSAEEVPQYSQDDGGLGKSQQPLVEQEPGFFRKAKDYVFGQSGKKDEPELTKAPSSPLPNVRVMKPDTGIGFSTEFALDNTILTSEETQDSRVLTSQET
jgi:hypothetical protein